MYFVMGVCCVQDLAKVFVLWLTHFAHTVTCSMLFNFRYEIEGCEVIWAIKDKSIASTFVDEGAAQFFLPHLNSEKQQAHQIVKRQKFSIDRCKCASSLNGLFRLLRH